MNDRERPPMDELDDALRRAVEAVRAEPQPAEALARSLERARKIYTPVNGRLRFFNQRLLAVAGLAAAVIVGSVYWMKFTVKNSPEAQFARLERLTMDEAQPGVASNYDRRLGVASNGTTPGAPAIAAQKPQSSLDGRVNENSSREKIYLHGMNDAEGEGPLAQKDSREAGARRDAERKPAGEPVPPDKIKTKFSKATSDFEPNPASGDTPQTPGLLPRTDTAGRSETQQMPRVARPAASAPASRGAVGGMGGAATPTQAPPPVQSTLGRGGSDRGDFQERMSKRAQATGADGTPAAPAQAPSPRQTFQTRAGGSLESADSPRANSAEELRTKAMSAIKSRESADKTQLGAAGGSGNNAKDIEETTRLLAELEQQYSIAQRLQNSSQRAMTTNNMDAMKKEIQLARKRVEDAQQTQQLSETDLKLEVTLGEKRVEILKRLKDQKAISPEMYQEAEKTLEAAKKNLQKAHKPQVWHRDRQRPSFARVYVGNGNSLELVSLNVTVTVEGPRARTVVDHIFRNPHNRVLEGTFEYPLPTGASASYFAMFSGQARDTVPQRFGRRGDVQSMPTDALARLTPAELVKQVSAEDWGTLQEARVVGKTKALETYEEIVRGNIDPALLEYSGGNTFSGRVFPIQAHGYNRVLISYEELLPFTQHGVQYRFPLPDCKLTEMQFSLSADAGESKEASFEPSDAQKAEGGGRVTYNRAWKEKGPGGDVLFSFAPAKPQMQIISGRQGESGPLYFYARVRPELVAEESKAFAEHAVFLLDTSLSEHPDRFDVNMRLLRKILESDAAIKQFNILTFDVAGRWVEPKGWLDNTTAGRNTAWSRLDGIVLEGATDIAAALDKLANVDLPANAPLDVFLLSDGQITWGETDVGTLVARYENRCRQQVRFHCYRTGIGADNLELFEALTRRGGGVFNCYSEADLNAAALAHRHHCFQLERVSLMNGPRTSDLLVAGRKAAIYPGGELIVAARANQIGRVDLLLEGQFMGKRQTLKFPLDIDGNGELAPRGWAEVAVASLLALNDPKLDELVTAYCQQFGIGSRVASFLVLENPNDYKRLNLEAERGRTVPGGDLGIFLEQTWMNLGKVEGAKQAFEHFLAKVFRNSKFEIRNSNHVRPLLAVLDDNDFTLPEQPGGGALLHQKDVSPEYLAARGLDRRAVTAYLTEARRRNNRKDVDGAVRVLSSVIEEHPGHADALRLVGYRLLALNQFGQAAQLFRQVLNARPFEPHSYRDFARGLEDCGKFGLAALQYEIVLAGHWHNRFRESLKGVSQEEYVGMMRQALSQRTVTGKLAELFAGRLEQLASVKTQCDLRVTISWNTDATDVDLWVIEPDGTKCFYQHNRTKNGGELSQDETQGYGPERYQVAKMLPGAYTIIVHYYRANPNLLAGETHVNVVVTRHAGTPDETSERHTVILKKPNEEVEACKVK